MLQMKLKEEHNLLKLGSGHSNGTRTSRFQSILSICSPFNHNKFEISFNPKGKGTANVPVCRYISS